MTAAAHAPRRPRVPNEGRRLSRDILGEGVDELAVDVVLDVGSSFPLDLVVVERIGRVPWVRPDGVGRLATFLGRLIRELESRLDSIAVALKGGISSDPGREMCAVPRDSPLLM